MSKLYTADDVAKICQVTPWTVREWCKAGRIKASKPGKSWRISEESLREFLTERHGE